MSADRPEILAALVFAGIMGCSGATEHPLAERGAQAAVDGVDEWRVSPAEAAQVAAEVATARAKAEACTPGAFQACRHYYKDSSGQLHCPESIQFCAASGTGWLACGQPPDSK